ncbi:hypothetical protein QF000_000007 [Paraburkholderia atlantica]|uniref:Uncharacterized protein n=2 Tax=Paraburkholderia TaxID=1822464 RepID=A0A7W8P8K7_9BURK|nr:hypothetical protein [Paraburkholderia youngii]MBB5421643.1 hypothetical protein [Paraburkholderia atlantica]MBB5429633.1 hypothetical protein [Paraburkholderia atlantica]
MSEGKVHWWNWLPIPLFVLARSLIAGKEPAAEVFRTPAAIVKCFYRN